MSKVVSILAIIFLLYGCGDKVTPSTQTGPGTSSAQDGTPGLANEKAQEDSIAGQEKQRDFLEKLLDPDAEVKELLQTPESGASEKDRNPLLEAVKEGDSAKVKKLLSEGANPNVSNKYGTTALHLAAGWNRGQIIEILVSAGANVNKKHPGRKDSPVAYGWTPLHFATHFDHVAAVKLLISNGANVNAKDQEAHTPLHLAKSRVVADVLISSGADIDARDIYSTTPVLWTDSEEVAELLVEKDADVNATDKTGTSLLHRAALKGFTKIAEQLISGGIDVNVKDGHEGDTPIHLAARTGRKRIAELLLAHGANVNARTNYKSTPLHQASLMGRDEVAELLLAKGAEVSPKNYRGTTPLDYASSHGGQEVAKLLVEAGADVNTRGAWNGKTPLHWAAQKGWIEVVKLLIAKGADVSAKTICDLTPTFSGCSRNRFYLYDLRDIPDTTPLHLAICEGHTSIAKFLLEKGADISAKDGLNKWTPLHYAANFGNKEIAILLISKGADVNAKGSDKKTPADVARENEHPELAKLLSKNVKSGEEHQDK